MKNRIGSLFSSSVPPLLPPGERVRASVTINGWFLRSPSTGTGQYLRQLLTQLLPLAHDCGIRLSLVAPRPEPVAGVPLLVAPPTLPGTLGKVEFEQLTFPGSARRSGTTITHIPYFGPPLRSSRPTIITIHDLIPMLLPEYRERAVVRLYTRVAAAGARQAQIILADSESSRRDIIAHLHIPPERVRVVYLAADSRFHPQLSLEELARVRARYHLPARYVLYLGGFDARKNVNVVVKAFAALDQEAAGCSLVIAGRLPGRTSLFFPDPRIGAGREVQFIGHVSEEDKPAVYSGASVFVYPSRYEGFGLPPLEAMACGAPVLCSSASSLPEVVGQAGILLNPERVPDWSAALRSVLNDPGQQQELRGRGLSRSKQYSWQRTARETLDAYLYLINGSLSDTMNER